MNVDLYALERLCQSVGIGDEYTDIWGNLHRISDAARITLLQEMGVVRDPRDVPRALKECEERCWRRGLDPVVVVRQEAPPYALLYRCPESDASRPHLWTLALENGETFSHEFQPIQLTPHAQRDIDGVPYTEVIFHWHERLPLGYHRFAVLTPGEGTLEGGAQASVTTSLIVTPQRCYLPAELEREGRVWGPTLQLYALRSKRNWGIGDFTDLRNIMDIVGAEGAALVGLNPLHALFPHNPRHASPYSPSSRLFLNFLYLDVEAIPEFSECTPARERVASDAFQARLRALRAGELVDYSGVAELKRQVLELVFAHFLKHHLYTNSERGKAFRQYRRSQSESLERFATYHALQEHFHTQDSDVWGWPVWPAEYRDPASGAVQRFIESQGERITYQAWLQWLADEQLAACAAGSAESGSRVRLYRDLAISIDRAGAETWAWQSLYPVGASVGAPPDDFNLYGQDWGLPPPIPERLRETAYVSFVEVLRANMRHASALRIDHVMGLLRLFWIPSGAQPVDGHYVYYPFHDLLGILALESQRHRCMVVGEDLGTVPDEVRSALRSSGVLSYRLLLFEHESDGSFKQPAAYPAQSVVSVATHDLPTLKGFWVGHELDLRASLQLFTSEEVRAQQIVKRAQDRAWLLWALEQEGLLPPGLDLDPVSVPEMTPELTVAIHTYLARSPAKVMMVQMEDVFGQLEQVNLPGTVEQYPNWRRKLPLNLEEWTANRRFTATAEALKRERGVGPSPEKEPVVPPPERRSSPTSHGPPAQGQTVGSPSSAS
jgi:(1->4)-alpha-D-glucan 1-alpha-D-glucosylmutase